MPEFEVLSGDTEWKGVVLHEDFIKLCVKICE